MGYICNFEGCSQRATRYESVPLLSFRVREGATENEVAVRVFCANHYGEDECPGHVASAHDPQVCGRCGIHIDSLRPEFPDV